MKKLRSFLVISICMMAVLFCAMALKAEAANVTTGTIGDNKGITWTYDADTKTLTITGEDSGLNGTYTGSVFDIKSQFADICSDVEVIRIENCTLSGSAQGMFARLKSLKRVEFDNFNTMGVTDMSRLFYGCTGLESLDLRELDTQNVIDMGSMFYQCKNLSSLNISSFNTAKVTNMQWMFGFCEKLTQLDVSSFNTSNVTSMNSMFGSCDNLLSLNLSNFDTANVTDMSYMFGICKKLTAVDISSFNTAKVKYMREMFCQCNSLLSLDLSHFNTTNVYNMYGMFEGCSSLGSLDLSNFNTAKISDMSEMFEGCKNLSRLNISSFNTTKVTNMSEMFDGCAQLSELSVSHFDTAKVTNMSEMFRGCNNVKELDVSGFVTTKVTNMSYMFNGCRNVSSLEVSDFDTAKVTGMAYMFAGCIGLDSLDVSNFNTAKVTDMSGMFGGYKGQNSLDLSGFITENVTNMEGMFGECKLASLDLSTFNTANVTDMSEMFQNCSNLSSLDLSSFDTSKVTDTYYMFNGCTSLTSLDLSSFDLSQMKYGGYVFDNCKSLKIIYTPKTMREESFISLPTQFVDPKGTVTGSIKSPFCNTTLVNRQYLVKRISLNKNNLSLEIGGTDQLSATISPETAVKKSVKWTSSDTNVATVDANGKVSAVGGGWATITATAEDGSGISAACSVTVIQPVTGIVLNQTSLSLNVGASETLTVTVSPGNATDKNVIWKSSDTAVAIVDTTGKVTAVGEGSATITATAADGSGVSASCSVTVTEPVKEPVPETPESQVRAFVERMYTVALGRAAEAEGLDFYVQRLLSGDSNGACLAESFLCSPEFANKGHSDAEYVKVLYRTFFDREPAAEEVNYWVGQLNSGKTRAFVLAGFVNSVEFDNLCAQYGISRGFMREDGKPLNPGIGRFAERLYTVVLERAGEKEGIEYWSLSMANGTCTPKDAAKSFYLSQEYINKNTSDAQYITTLYRTFMDREPEAGGVEYWQNVLNNGATREQILEGFADSAEFKGIMASFGL